MSEPRCETCEYAIERVEWSNGGKQYRCGHPPGKWKGYLFFTDSSPIWCPLRTLELADPEPDQISHPSHYVRYEIEPVDFLQSLTRPKSGPPVPWHALNVIKYITRYQTKNGLEDLRKARQYLDWLIAEEERHDERNVKAPF